MRANLTVKEKVAKSSEAFRRYVLPVLFSPEDRIRFEPVEGATGRVSELLDYAGIDWLWRGPNDELTAVSQRTQVVRRNQRPFNTFTVRVSRLSGSDTEWQKTLKALNSGGRLLVSFVTMQSYLSEDYQLLSSGRMKTRDLMESLVSAPPLRRVINTEDGTQFVAPKWEWLQSIGRPVRVWSSQISLAA